MHSVCAAVKRAFIYGGSYDICDFFQYQVALFTSEHFIYQSQIRNIRIYKVSLCLIISELLYFFCHVLKIIEPCQLVMSHAVAYTAAYIKPVLLYNAHNS